MEAITSNGDRQDFSEAETCNGIVNAAMSLEVPTEKIKLKEYKVWSLGRKDVHHADSGSNTKIEHTTAVIDGRLSGMLMNFSRLLKKPGRIYFGT